MVKNVGAGINEVTWDGRTSGNRFVADGLYLCRVSASDGSVEFKMAVIRK
jgi:flagellar hook assembly protein FlgD